MGLAFGLDHDLRGVKLTYVVIPNLLYAYPMSNGHNEVFESGINELRIRREVVARPIDEVRKGNAGIVLAKTLYIDHTPLYTILGKSAEGLESILDLTPDFRSADAFALRSAPAATELAEFTDIGLMGLALASGTATPFLLEKIPLFTCCGDPYCGYIACTVTFTNESVVWSSFGTVFSNLVYGKDESDEEWQFRPLDDSPTFKFDRPAYEAEFRDWLPQPDLKITVATAKAAVAAALPKTFATSDQRLSSPVLPTPALSTRELELAMQRLRALELAQRLEFQGTKTPVPWWERLLDFAMRSHFWPNVEAERLERLLAEHDPLCFAAHGPLNSWAYSTNTASSAAYLKFIKTPHGKLTSDLHKTFGVNPDPTRIDAVIRDFLAPLREK